MLAFMPITVGLHKMSKYGASSSVFCTLSNYKGHLGTMYSIELLHAIRPVYVSYYGNRSGLYSKSFIKS